MWKYLNNDWTILYVDVWYFNLLKYFIRAAFNKSILLAHLMPGITVGVVPVAVLLLGNTVNILNLTQV